MIKGVNRQIIEVKNPDSEYFDRALLFLKTGAQVPPADMLSRLAREYVKSAEPGGEKSYESLGLGRSLKPVEYAARTKHLKCAVGILTAAFILSCAACAVLLIVYTKML